MKTEKNVLEQQLRSQCMSDQNSILTRSDIMINKDSDELIAPRSTLYGSISALFFRSRK